MSEAYAREVTKRAVATACVALDFKTSHQNTIESLSDVVRHYCEKVG